MTALTHFFIAVGVMASLTTLAVVVWAVSDSLSDRRRIGGRR